MGSSLPNDPAAAGTDDEESTFLLCKPLWVHLSLESAHASALCGDALQTRVYMLERVAIPVRGSLASLCAGVVIQAALCCVKDRSHKRQRFVLRSFKFPHGAIVWVLNLML